MKIKNKINLESWEVWNLIINTNFFDKDIFDILSWWINKSINNFDLDQMNIIKLFDIRKKIEKVITNKYIYKSIIDNIYQKIKKWYPYSARWLNQCKYIPDMIIELKEICDICYQNKKISKQEYIFVMQDILWWWEFWFDSLFTKVTEFDSYTEWDKNIETKYSMRLEKQNVYSKQITDSVKWLKEISVSTYIANIHIETHEKNEKLDMKKLVKDIYRFCKVIENQYEIKPKYILNITHLNLFFRRYGFDIYDLPEDISSNTWSYKNKIMEDIYTEKPKDWDDKKRRKYQSILPKLKKVQEKFTHKDIKLWIMDYDKFIVKIEELLKISKNT